MGLAWLSPLFLIGALAAAIPIALHLFLQRRAPIVDFAAMRYLTAAPIERASRRRLKEWLLLALRVAALLLLAAAFARPYFAQAVAPANGRATAILLDTSASMTAPGQFEQARSLALDVLTAVPSSEAVAIITFGTRTEVVSALSNDRAAARAVLQQVQPAAGATRYADALANAADVLRNAQGRLVVITDLQSSGWDASGATEVPDSVSIEVRDVPGPAANVGIDSLRRDGNGAVAVVHNYAPQPATHVVTFTRADTPIGRSTVLVPAFATAEAQVPLAADVTGDLHATVDDVSGFAADNGRFAVLSASRAPRVAIITSSGDTTPGIYVSKALEAAEGGVRMDVQRLSALQVSALTATELGTLDVVVILGTRGLDQRGREALAGFVRRGGGLFVAAGPDVDQSFIRDALATLVKTVAREREGSTLLTFAPLDMRHPIFRPLGEFGTLAHVQFSRAVTLDASGSATVLARFSDGSAALVDERTAQTGHVLFFASDLGNVWNTLPLQPAFAPLLHEAVSYLAQRPEGRSEFLVGELTQQGGDLPGILTLDGRQVAVNVDPRESNPERTSVEAFAAAVHPLTVRASVEQSESVRGSEQAQGLWQYGLGMMLAMLVAEGALGRRMG